MNRTVGSIEPRPTVVSISVMAPSAVSSLLHIRASILHNDMFLYMRPRTKEMKGWGVTR